MGEGGESESEREEIEREGERDEREKGIERGGGGGARASGCCPRCTSPVGWGDGCRIWGLGLNVCEREYV